MRLSHYTRISSVSTGNLHGTRKSSVILGGIAQKSPLTPWSAIAVAESNFRFRTGLILWGRLSSLPIG